MSKTSIVSSEDETSDHRVIGDDVPADSWRDRIFKATHHPIKAWAVLALSLLITWIAFDISKKFVIERGQDRFHFDTQDIKAAIAKRMQDQEEVLRGGVGLFAASSNVTRADWKAYVDSLALERYYPGLQGFGFSQKIQPSDLDAHIRQVREEGFLDYTVRPASPRAAYTSIIYLEPFDWRNQRAFGFDMFSEPNRRAAMERARDSGEPSATRLVTLVQETKEDVQRGFLLYFPVYRNGEPTGTVAERRNALRGYVYSPFRMDDLMSGILGEGNPNTEFEIFDGTTISNATLLYNSRHTNTPDAHPDDHLFQRLTTLEFGGNTWTLRFSSDAGFMSTAEKSQPFVIMAGGLLIDLLVFFVIGSIARQQVRAEALAQSRTTELREQNERFNVALENMLHGVAVFDRKAELIVSNERFATIYDLRPDNVKPGMALIDIVRRRIAHGVYSGDNPDAYIEERLNWASGSAGRQTVVHELSNGRSIQVSRQPVTGGGWVATHEDVTEIKRVERLKSEFISLVSHELRTPLTSLTASLGLVGSGAFGNLPAKAMALLDIAQRNSQRLTGLVNEILDVEKISSDCMEFRLTRADIVELARKAIVENRAFAAEHDIRLKLKCELTSAYVHADENRMMQVLTNLLSNAAKFSSKGSDVVLRVSRIDGIIRTEVIDEGTGISEENQAQLFDRFYQVDSADNRRSQGSGLGLTIVKAIVAKHGSTINIDSEIGKGSTFHFDLEEMDATNETSRPSGTVDEDWSIQIVGNR